MLRGGRGGSHWAMLWVRVEHMHPPPGWLCVVRAWALHGSCCQVHWMWRQAHLRLLRRRHLHPGVHSWPVLQVVLMLVPWRPSLCLGCYMCWIPVHEGWWFETDVGWETHYLILCNAI